MTLNVHDDAALHRSTSPKKPETPGNPRSETGGVRGLRMLRSLWAGPSSGFLAFLQHPYGRVTGCRMADDTHLLNFEMWLQPTSASCPQLLSSVDAVVAFDSAGAFQGNTQTTVTFKRGYLQDPSPMGSNPSSSSPQAGVCIQRHHARTLILRPGTALTSTSSASIKTCLQWPQK